MKKIFISYFIALLIIMICVVGCDDNDDGCTLCEKTDEDGGWSIRPDLCSENQRCRLATDGRHYCFDLTSEDSIRYT